jgi:hypothetical protein
LLCADNNNEKQGAVFWGHEVFSPKTIAENNIDTVIITSVVYADDICKEIKKIIKMLRRLLKYQA